MAVRIVLFENLAALFALLDSPGTYIMIMVFGLVLVPYYTGLVRHHLNNPQSYHTVSFEGKFWAGLLVIIFLLVYGLINFIRFLPS